MKKTRLNQRLFNTDTLMRETFERLVQDFEPTIGTNLALRIRANLYCDRTTWRSMRDFEWPCAIRRTPYGFKCQYQLMNFTKRYIFENDLRTETELREESLKGFIIDQFSYGLPLKRQSTRVILKHARRIAAEVLGPFSYELWFKHSKFGKKAAYGLPARDAYLDNRILNLTGSRFQRNAFRACLLQDSVLRDCMNGDVFTCNIDADPVLALTAVPKSYKAMRLIAPDTVIGGFLSLGLGGYIRAQLEGATHIRLASASDQHKRLAKFASESGHLVTADLSKASDSFTWEHIKSLLPEDWLAPLMTVRNRRCEVKLNENTELLELRSFMLMGAGHTFPLQTLLFYCLLKAIADCLEISTKCYVFGDDLIYHHKMHKYVLAIFEDFGLRINVDKTFADGSFRESCGGDYHTGVDVRPHMPEGQAEMLNHTAYAATVYKMINGLLSRWDEEDIPETIDYLLKQITTCARSILIVPQSAGVYAGLHNFQLEALHGKPVSWPSIEHQNSIATSAYDRITLDKRYRQIRTELPYYWEVLRSSSLCEDELVFNSNEVVSTTTRLSTKIDSKWRPLREPVLVMRNGCAHVAMRGNAHRYGYSTVKQSGIVWPGLEHAKHVWTKKL